MYRGRVDLSLVVLSHNSVGFMSSSVRSCPEIFLYFFPSQLSLFISFPTVPGDLVLMFHYPCESTVLNHFAIKTFCTSRNDNWIQLSVRKTQIAFIAKLVKHWPRVLITSLLWLSSSRVRSHTDTHLDVNGSWRVLQAVAIGTTVSFVWDKRGTKLLVPHRKKTDT